ncbi:MAG: hypothetical protein IKN38_10770 [Clostridia bacterium]|nr:hypothetical protein [Clostridia bacterium]
MPKRVISLLLAVAFLLLSGCSGGSKMIEADKTIDLPDTGDISVSRFASENGYFYKNTGSGKGDLLYVLGVNIGLTGPHTDLSEADLSREVFDRWLDEIGETGANTVRAFTLMNPDFYGALYDYNKLHPDAPLSLIQGIWFPEYMLDDPGDALDPGETVRSAFIRSITETLDAVHGSSTDTAYGSRFPAIFDKDVSEFVTGYILGLEYPAEFVINTNEAHADEASYDGEYLFTADSSAPFEAFLAYVGDSLIKYETKTYSHQTPVSFLNQQSLDVMTHSSEPFPEESDAVSVDMRNIKAKDTFQAGLFASFDVYPYYPEFMDHQPEYLNYADEDGVKDNFRAYLYDLKASCDMPLLIAEYGLSTSRGVAHNGVCGYKEGGLGEREAAQLLKRMTTDISKAGCAGGLVFEWADEWFKRTWNEISFEPDDSAYRTHNLGSAEQSFGLIAFEDPAAVPDGDDSEWITVTGIDRTRTCVMYDDEYLHLLVSFPEGFDFERDRYYVPISITGEGSLSMGDVSFSSPADYVLVIDGKDNTRLLCDEFRDVFLFRQAYLRGIYGKDRQIAPRRGSGEYHDILSLIANEMYLPDEGVTLEPEIFTAGEMRYGNASPDSDDFDSLADFSVSHGKLEIRIAWNLLGVVNPRTKTCIGPLEGDSIIFTDFETIMIGAGAEGTIELVDTGFDGVGERELHERKKLSYFSVSEAFAQISEDISD